MKMKKITAMALACVMALGLAACGGTSSSTGTSADSAAPASSTGTAAEPCDLVVAWWGSQGRNEKFQSALDLYAEQNPGVTIESQTNGFSDHLTALSAAAASNDMPDMAMLQGAYYQQYVDGDLLVDLMPYVESGALDLSNVSESVLAATTIDGKLYGVCAGTNSPSVIYNKTLLDEAGITIEDNMNLDQFAEKCAEIYEKTGYRSFISNPSQMIEMLVRGEGKILYETDKLGVESAEELQPYFALLERGREEGWLMDYSLTVGLDATEEQPIIYGTTPETSSWCSFKLTRPMPCSRPLRRWLALTTGLGKAEGIQLPARAMSWAFPTRAATSTRPSPC
ncbi:MAG: ABC transporter substrate-binding protein [Ruthenibacterium lactatiformans]